MSVDVTYQSWGQRLMKSIGGVLAGLLLFALSFPLLFWNEGRAVTTAKSLDEGQSAVVSVSADKVDPANDKKLVHVSAATRTDEKLKDPDFAVEVNAIKLNREVEMFQWVEKKHEREEKLTGGGSRTITTYEYEKEWVDHAVSSEDFHDEGYGNPGPLPYQAASESAQTVTLGAFTLSSEQVGKLNDAEDLSVDGATAKSVEGGKPEAGGVYIGANPASPSVGDVKVKWRVVKAGPTSVVGVQAGNSFSPYHASAGDDLLLVKQSTMTAAQMFQAAQEENAMMTWVLRFVFWLFMFVGLLLVFKPISVFGDVIPFFGSMLGAGLGVFAFLFASGLSMLTIAVAWLVYRPLLGVLLLLVAGGAIFGLVTLSRKRSAAKKAAGGAPPGPMPAT